MQCAAGGQVSQGNGRAGTAGPALHAGRTPDARPDRLRRPAEGERMPSQREMMAHWRISMQTASKVIGALKTEGLAMPSVGRDTIVAPGAAARIAAAAPGTAHAAAASPRPRPALRSPPSPRARQPRPAWSRRSSPSPPAAAPCAARRPAKTTDSPSASPSPGTPRKSPTAPPPGRSQPMPAGVLAYIAEATGEPRSPRERGPHRGPADDDTATTLGIAPARPS